MSTTRRLRRTTALLAGVLLSLACISIPAAANTRPDTGLRDVLVVGNSQAGTVTFIDGHTFANLGSFNVIPDLSSPAHRDLREPDLARRLRDDPSASRAATASSTTRPSRPTAARCTSPAATSTTSPPSTWPRKPELWHTRLGGFHADHAALSPDGTRYVVSATTAQEAEVFDTATGQRRRHRSPTGTYPHQNDYSADGKYIYNSSIGIISLPQSLEWAKGSFLLTKVDASTLKVVQTWTFPHGIRPNVIAPDGHTFYTDLSYLNGFVKYDLNTSADRGHRADALRQWRRGAEPGQLSEELGAPRPGALR